MNELDRLIAIEGIRNIKASYWYFMDTKQWDKLGMVFTRDAVVDFRGERDLKPGEAYDRLTPVEQAVAEGDVAVARGRDNIVAFIRGVVEFWTTVHHGAAPIIDIIDQTNGKAIWPLFDYIDDGNHALKGYGHYHETYRPEEDGIWRIDTLQLTRLRSDGEHPAAFVPK